MLVSGVQQSDSLIHIHVSDITLPTKVHLVKTMAFSSSHVWMWEVDHKESWGLKNWSFELWCWRRLLRVPWTARRSNQSILKEISPEYSLEGLMLKLRLHYSGHLMRRVDSLEKTLMLGKIEGRRRRGWQRTRWMDGITDLMDMSLSKLRDMVKDREVWHAAVHGVGRSQTRLSDWATTTILFKIFFPFRLLQSTEQSSLCCTIGPCWLSILNRAVFSCQFQTPNVCFPKPFPRW